MSLVTLFSRETNNTARVTTTGKGIGSTGRVPVENATTGHGTVSPLLLWEIFNPFSRASRGYHRGNERERVTGGVGKLVIDGMKQGSLKVAKTKSFFRCGGRTIISHNSPTAENSFVKQWNAVRTPRYVKRRLDRGTQIVIKSISPRFEFA